MRKVPCTAAPFYGFRKAKDQSQAVNGLLALVFCRGFSISSCCGSMFFQQAVLLLVNVDSSNAVGHSTVYRLLPDFLLR